MEASTYVNSKHRYRADVGDEPIAVKLPGNATDADVLHAMHALNSNSDCTGFIVQLPLPEPIRQGVVLESIDPAKMPTAFIRSIWVVGARRAQRSDRTP